MVTRPCVTTPLCLSPERSQPQRRHQHNQTKTQAGCGNRSCVHENLLQEWRTHSSLENSTSLSASVGSIISDDSVPILYKLLRNRYLSAKTNQPKGITRDKTELAE